LSPLTHTVASALDSRVVGAIKIVVAIVGTGVLVWGAAASSRPGADRHRRVRDVVLAIVGVLSFACWWNLGRFHFGSGYLQVNDQYHYYVGSKYTRELGYTKLYDCTAVADAQDGLVERVRRRWMRNLETNDLERSSAILASPQSCTSRFTPERWQAFKHDVAWFRDRLSPAAWDQLQIDHGYNATPVWGIVGHALSSLAPASDAQIVALALVDPALLVMMWAAVWWAFGWRTMCVAMVWWGTNYPARFAWNGGSFLRADWLALTTAGVCFARRDRPVLAGAALGYATLLRVFPVVVFAGLIVRAVASMWRARSLRPRPEHLRLAAGAALAAAILVPLSLVTVGGSVAGGAGLWKQFIDNSRKHYSTPATNNVGLRVLAAYAPDSRLADLSEYWVNAPLDSWMAARRRVLGSREPFYLAAVAAFLVMFAAAARKHDDWIALALGVALLPVVFELTCYYFAVLLVLGLLWSVRPLTGVTLAAAAAMSSVPAVLLRWDDDVYAAVTAVILVLCTVVTAILARDRESASTSSGRLSYSS
jgi:hypothetical protein